MQDVMGNQTFSITQLIKVQQNCFEKFNLFEIQIINRMADKVRTQIEENKKESQENSQQIKRKKNIQLIQQVLFDEKLSQAFYQMLNCFFQKSKLLDALNQDTIDLDNLEKLGNKLLQDRSEVKTTLKSLIVENGSQTQLQKMCRLYDLVLDIDNYFERKISQQKQFNCLTSIPLSSKESCSVYISFSTKLGIVTKISNNFENVVPVYSNKEVIGKNINFMQPDVVAPLHNRILTNFIQKKVVSQKVADYPLLIGKDKKGFSIPYDIKIQVAMIGLEDFGCAGWIKQIKDSIHYIMTSADQGFKNFIMGQAFYDLILSFSFKQSELSNVKFGNLIPLFQTLFDNNMSGKPFQTILIRPQHKEQISNSIKLSNNESLFQELINFDLYQIQAQFIYLSTTFAKFNYLLITQLDYLDSLQSKRDALKEFRKDLKFYNQSEEYDEIDFEELYPIQKNESAKNIQDKQEDESAFFLNTFYDQSIVSLQDERFKKSSIIVKPSHFQEKPSHFQDKQILKKSSKLKTIIKENRFKIKKMYKNLQYSFGQGQFQAEDQIYSKIDYIQENNMSHLSTFHPLNSHKQSFNTLITSRAEQYLDEAKLNDSIQIQNSQQTHQNNIDQGIEQMLFEDSKLQKGISQETKLNTKKKNDKRKQKQYSQKSKTKQTINKFQKTKKGNDQETNVSADISFLFNQKERQQNAQGSVNLSNKKSISQTRIQLVNKIQSSSKRHLLFYSGYILDSLLLILVLISVSISISLNYSFVGQYQTLQNLHSDLNDVKKLIYNLLEEIHLIDGVQKNYFNIQNSLDQQNFLQTLNDAKYSNVNQYKNISATIFKDYPSSQRVQDLYKSKLNYEFLSNVQQKFISQEIFNSSLLITLIRTQQLLTMFVNITSNEDFIFQNELRHNQNQTQSQISQILAQLIVDHTTNYSIKQWEILIFIIVYSIFVFFYSILLLLFYINSFSLKQSLLSIFATIDIKKIDEMINRTTQAIKHFLELKKSNKFLDLNNQKQEGQTNYSNKLEINNNNNCKKKNISLTTYKKNLTAGKIIFIVICLSLILIKPCVQYYFVQLQVDFMKISGSLQSKF
ncbi:transmembrane protein, putative (macronuclear) [Tetrahymena thermophila SB210]|uniref:Transmembrane protein, putative n=1 Tax=Tetrahymena thermophila (strain SB210) TaxID=312017 RepID=Q23QC0_TETTS|nr:transmembrane protein, putative [Tetrahymena thermophila SB210]EAR98664.2 transmembrane protein, putative [Tetrahymena thermophila SB210]|eukprot:XP_001018909.2 transmembrane protein, putative [Tetrahymena thermophila SB210]